MQSNLESGAESEEERLWTLAENIKLLGELYTKMSEKKSYSAERRECYAEVGRNLTNMLDGLSFICPERN